MVVTFTDTPEDVFDKWIIESSIELKPLEETDEEGMDFARKRYGV